MYKESTLHIIAINFFWSLMEKTGRGLCVCARASVCMCADWKVMDYFHVVRNTMFSLAQQDILFARSNSEILCISAAGPLPKTKEQKSEEILNLNLKKKLHSPTKQLMSHSEQKSICTNVWLLSYMSAFNKIVNNYSFKCYLELQFKIQIYFQCLLPLCWYRLIYFRSW